MTIASRDIIFSFLFLFFVDFDLHISSIEIFLVFNHLKALPRMSPNAWCLYSCNCKLSSFLPQVYITKGLELLKFFTILSMYYYYYFFIFFIYIYIYIYFYYYYYYCCCCYYCFVVKLILRQSKTIILRTGAWYNN